MGNIYKIACFNCYDCLQGEGEEEEKYERHDFEKPNPFVQEGEESEIASVAYR